MGTPETKGKALLSGTVTSFTIVKDGFLPGFLPAFRVVTVTVDGSGRANVEASKQKYVIQEAQSIVDDKLRETLGI